MVHEAFVEKIDTLISLSGGIGVGVAWFGFGGTVGVIFENIEFCIFGIVGIVWAGRGIAQCRYETIF